MGPDIFYEMPEYAGEAISVVGVFLLVYFIIILGAMAISITMYLLQSFGLYKIGGTLKIENPWLAFIPVANIYMLGKIAEAAPTVPGKKPRKYSTLLLWLSLATIGVFIIGYIVIIIMAVLTSGTAITMSESTAAMGGAVVTVILAGIVWYAAIMGTTITYMVFYYIALHKVFKLFAPENAVLYTVLSIILGIHPILLFIIRKKMPVFENQAYQTV